MTRIIVHLIKILDRYTLHTMDQQIAIHSSKKLVVPYNRTLGGSDKVTAKLRPSPSLLTRIMMCCSREIESKGINQEIIDLTVIRETNDSVNN